MNFINSFKKAMQQAGLSYTGDIIADGAIHRFHVDGDTSGNKNGWYLLYNDQFPAGVFGCWKRGINEQWCAKDLSTFSKEEKQQYQKNLEEAKAKQKKAKHDAHAKAGKLALSLYVNAKHASDTHPYLRKKNVNAYGLHEDANGRLLIPVCDTEKTFHGLQFITANGDKRFLPDSSIKGHYYSIGTATDTLYICEGFATAATIQRATDSGVIVAFDSGNLSDVAQVIRAKFPNKTLVICADNDQWNEVNIGVIKATEAAQKNNEYLVIPLFHNMDVSTKPTDFNDLMQLAGLDEVRKQLADPTQSSRHIISTTNQLTVDDKPNQRGKDSQASLLLALVNEVEFFHDEQKQAYATFLQQNHYETWPLDSNGFENWLVHRYWQQYKKAPNKNALQDSLAIMQGRALFEGKCHKVFMRVGEFSENIYLNIANKDRQVVEVSRTGWQLLNQTSVKFKCSSHMRSLPIPQVGGNINLLWDHLNIPENARKLVIAWILECWRPNTNFPILLLTGEHGSAKSTTQNILRNLIDPNVANLRGAPKKSEDILIAAVNNWLVSFNNLSSLTTQNQDDLCCLATGGGLATRQLFSTADEYVNEIKRPVIINAINDLINAQDLIDRCIAIELPIIDAKQRKADGVLIEKFDADSPLILGALLDIFVKTLQILPSVQLFEKPRMADFALLGTALERVLDWEPGSFLAEYKANREASLTLAMEHSPIVVALIELIETQGRFDGSFHTLYKTLTSGYKSTTAGWPNSAKGLSNILKRQVAALKIIGFEVVFHQTRRADGYHLFIQKQVHHVQQVHQPNEIAALAGVHSNCQKATSQSSTSKVHLENPYNASVNVLNEHSELRSESQHTLQRIII